MPAESNHKHPWGDAHLDCNPDWFDSVVDHCQSDFVGTIRIGGHLWSVVSSRFYSPVMGKRLAR
jgi:hypothetical protein